MKIMLSWSTDSTAVLEGIVAVLVIIAGLFSLFVKGSAIGNKSKGTVMVVELPSPKKSSSIRELLVNLVRV